MKAATVKQLKQELSERTPNELVELCLRLSKFKKENKELLSYLLYEASDENSYIENIKREIDHEFTLINTNTYYYIKKSVRKILRRTKTYIKYSKKKETEVELLIYYCKVLKAMTPSIFDNNVLHNIYLRQLEIIKKVISSLHDDLQYDYEMELNSLMDD